MSDKPQSRRRKILVWIVRVICISLVFGMSDVCSLSFGSQSRPIFSMSWFRTGNSDAGYIGFGYLLFNHGSIYRDGGRTLGPEIWYWFTPVVIDFAHDGIEIHWLWKR
jgi:hypothetical protein